MIKLFEQYNKEEDIHKLCMKYNIPHYTINSDMSIDVNEDVAIKGNFTKLPLTFRYVSGYFSCSNGKLTTLNGCPCEVGGDFLCDSNYLTTLEGCPIKVGGFFSIDNNEITTLKYTPQEIGDNIYLSNNPLPIEVKNCRNKKSLFKHQEEYGIWNADGSFNKGRFEIFKKELLGE